MSGSPARDLHAAAIAQDHKDRLVAQLRAEAMELRTREREYKLLQDQLLALE